MLPAAALYYRVTTGTWNTTMAWLVYSGIPITSFPPVLINTASLLPHRSAVVSFPQTQTPALYRPVCTCPCCKCVFCPEVAGRLSCALLLDVVVCHWLHPTSTPILDELGSSICRETYSAPFLIQYSCSKISSRLVNLPPLVPP